ncbi:hypothetical protein NA56DRAFT_711770 [Hyaloscypha hepaticicola]|uniref:Uncharacterized protein n=1 Tax=Hyaloscypha hepaticicola TaxID=2082293 RepID=A0A2J6PIP4_9HELO|nr:hypothetical protein NA56DRAFT_711770 [Hyaloscypha hepaticicola]
MSNTTVSSPVIKATSEDFSTNMIPSHTVITLHALTLCLTLDFTTQPSSFWTGEAFIPYRGTLLDTLSFYLKPAFNLPSNPPNILKVIISISFPKPRTQSNSIRLTQRNLVNRVAGLLKYLEGEIEILYMCEEIEWSQAQCLAPFFGLRGRRKIKLKEGGREARVLGAGSEMATKLQTEWRRMRDQRELY